MALTDGWGVDVAVEAVGIPHTFQMATEIVRPGDATSGPMGRGMGWPGPCGNRGGSGYALVVALIVQRLFDGSRFGIVGWIA